MEKIKEVIEGVRSNVYIEVKIVTNGTLQMNDNCKIVEEFKKMGFDYSGEPISQDNGEVHWTILEINKGFNK